MLGDGGPAEHVQVQRRTKTPPLRNIRRAEQGSKTENQVQRSEGQDGVLGNQGKGWSGEW